MSRPLRALALGAAAVSVAAAASACGSQGIELAKSNPLYHGAVLFQQRCSGCHSLSYAATHGSAANVRTAQYNNGPNFNIRCERPLTRVLYAIANGGFSGQIMPQNVVVGEQAIEVAKFVATYAGRQAPKVPGSELCVRQPVGSVPPAIAQAAASIPASPGSNAPTP